MTEDLRYPIGKFSPPASIEPSDTDRAIATIEAFPKHLTEAVDGWSAEQMNTPYREGGWRVIQLIHHIADSHSNAFTRVKLALTEDWPIIKAYDEKAWAELPDSEAPAEWSLGIVANTHARWVMLLKSMNEAQWKQGFVHPERGRSTLKQATLLYEWHSKHHLAHIVDLAAREGW